MLRISLIFPPPSLGSCLNFFAFFRGSGGIAIWTVPSHKHGKCNRITFSGAIRWATRAVDSVPSGGMTVLTIPP